MSEKIREHLKEFVVSLDDSEKPPWTELRTNPDLIFDSKYHLDAEDRKLLTRGPRHKLFDAIGRQVWHSAANMVWIAPNATADEVD